MIHASMLELARNGSLGPLRRGLTHGGLRDLLGSPPDWGPQQTEHRARIWRYGDVEFHFDNWRLALIFSDHDNLNDGGPTLMIDPWIVRRGVARCEFELHLRKEGVPFTVVSPQYLPSQQWVTTASGVKFSFVDEPEEECEESGLFAWSTPNVA